MCRTSDAESSSGPAPSALSSVARASHHLSKRARRRAWSPPTANPRSAQTSSTSRGERGNEDAFRTRDTSRARASSSSLIARAASASLSLIDAVRRKWSDHRDGGCGRMHRANRIKCLRRSRDSSKEAPAPNAPPTSPSASSPPSLSLPSPPAAVANASNNFACLRLTSAPSSVAKVKAWLSVQNSGVSKVRGTSDAMPTNTKPKGGGSGFARMGSMRSECGIVLLLTLRSCQLKTILVPFFASRRSRRQVLTSPQSSLAPRKYALIDARRPSSVLLVVVAFAAAVTFAAAVASSCASFKSRASPVALRAEALVRAAAADPPRNRSGRGRAAATAAVHSQQTLSGIDARGLVFAKGPAALRTRIN
mmetsp:Transcript_13962/g.37089  ORF Transcript_13962/g.37089 Transcript_13962/m.37089 type:complete len:365 (+) Transcript_13962:92-1186(+)